MVRNNPIYSVADNKEKIKEVAQARPHSYFRKSKPKTPHRKARLQRAWFYIKSLYNIS